MLLLASSGLLRQETSNVPIEADAVWAGILVGLGAVAWAFLPISSTRADTGYRRDRLPSLLCWGVLVATPVQLAALTVWPVIVGERAAPNDSLATFTSNPLSLAVMAGFVVAFQSFSAAAVLALVRLRVPTVFFAVLSFLAILGASIWQGVTLLGRAVTTTDLALWTPLALAGLVTMLLMAAWLGPRHT